MSTSSSATEFPYLHGFSSTEQARLAKQARLAESTVGLAYSVMQHDLRSRQ